MILRIRVEIVLLSIASVRKLAEGFQNWRLGHLHFLILFDPLRGNENNPTVNLHTWHVMIRTKDNGAGHDERFCDYERLALAWRLFVLDKIRSCPQHLSFLLFRYKIIGSHRLS
jgi:hypothetical protein